MSRALAITASAARIFLLLFRERSCQSHLSQEGPANLGEADPVGQKGCGHSAVTLVSKKCLHPAVALKVSLFPPLKGMHAEFSSQLINYAVLTLATVSLSLCKHEAVLNAKGWEGLAARTQWRFVSSSLNIRWCSL